MIEAPVPLRLKTENVGGSDLAFGDRAVPRPDDERADVSGGGRGMRQAREGRVHVLEARLVGEAEHEQRTDGALLAHLRECT